MKPKLFVKMDLNQLSAVLGWLLKEWKRVVGKPPYLNESSITSKNWEHNVQDLFGISL
jgi:hypothetical protein